jgi:hypothetical protein
VLVDARLQIKVWADVEQYSTAAAVYGAINDVLHGACGVATADGTIVRALEADGPMEMTDPDTGWVAVYAFYTVMARPGAGSFIGPSGSSIGVVGIWFYGAGAPSILEANGDYYLNLSTGDVYLQASGAWGSPIGNIKGAGGGSVPSLIYHKVAASGTNAANIKATAGIVTGGVVFNDTEYPIYVKLFNKASAPTLGTDTPVQTIGVQAGETAPIDIPGGLTYAAGIGIAITKGILDSDATAVAAGDCVVDIFYQ